MTRPLPTPAPGLPLALTDLTLNHYPPHCYPSRLVESHQLYDSDTRAYPMR